MISGLYNHVCSQFPSALNGTSSPMEWLVGSMVKRFLSFEVLLYHHDPVSRIQHQSHQSHKVDVGDLLHECLHCDAKERIEGSQCNLLGTSFNH
ncbi:hypothetical protein GOP47_0001346 [Adiantum capillus-veneris]|uniref:Uncharacterized protein n=1 Tax=Adiantum capillus-veneris TaxID=13818 RepID=A0A9D4V9I8_ADICA|nr:hypothetical protein GOP47_0001346 [Adiantum capillus-veneris]